MKKILHVLAVVLIAFSCLTFSQETKSEPVSAILIGVLWTYAVPGSLAAAGTYAAWLKAKEYVYNKQARKNGEAIAANAARLDRQGEQLSQLQKNITAVQAGQQEMRTDFRQQLNGVAQDLHGKLETGQEGLESLKTGMVTLQGSFGEFRVDIDKILKNLRNEQGQGQEEVREGLCKLSSQCTAFQRQQKKLDEKSSRICVRIGSQSKEIAGLRDDIKGFKESAAQVAEEVSKLHAGQAEILNLLKAGSSSGGSQRASNSVQTVMQRHFKSLSPAFLVMHTTVDLMRQQHMLSGFTHERYGALFGDNVFPGLAITSGD